MKLKAEEISKIQDELCKIFPSVVARKISDSSLLWTVDGVRVAETVKVKSSVKTTFARRNRATNRVSTPDGTRLGAVLR